MGKTKRENEIPENVVPLLSPLLAIQKLFDQYNNQGVVIGGVAISLLGKPRFTADIDIVLLLNLNDIPQLLKIASDLGIEPRISNPEIFARKNRMLLLRHITSGIDIDISLGLLPFEIEMVERREVHNIGPLELHLPTPEDLIILKAVAHRPKDMIDIQDIIVSHPNLDRKRIAYWVKQFADALEVPEIWEDIKKYIIE